MRPAAIEPLERAIYHANPEIRPIARDLSRDLRKNAGLQDILRFVRASVAKVRTRWEARDFKDLESETRKAFEPVPLRYVHYAPRKKIGDHLETDDQENKVGFKPYDPSGGSEDLLTENVASALNKEGGITFIAVNDGEQPTYERAKSAARQSDVLMFTLPDKEGWSSYIVVQVQNDFFVPAEGVVFHVELTRLTWTSLPEHLKVTPDVAGGVRIDQFAAPGTSQGFLRVGDRVRTVNGSTVGTESDFKKALADQPYLRLDIDRDGKAFTVEVKTTP